MSQCLSKSLFLLFLPLILHFLSSSLPVLMDLNIILSSVCLLRYFEAHLAVKTEQVKRSLNTSENGTIIPHQPSYKVRLLFLFLVIMHLSLNHYILEGTVKNTILSFTDIQLVWWQSADYYINIPVFKALMQTNPGNNYWGKYTLCSLLKHCAQIAHKMKPEKSLPVTKGEACPRNVIKQCFLHFCILQ